MMGVWMPIFARPSTRCGTPLAASSLLTVTRINSEPARASAMHCLIVESTSAVSVLVIDCTTTGASLPTRTFPMRTVGVLRRKIVGMLEYYFNIGRKNSRLQQGFVPKRKDSEFAAFFVY